MEENFETDVEQDFELVESVEEIPIPDEKPAALTLVIQSWATPIVGIIMLVTGLLGGYYGRPLLSPETDSAVVEESSSVDNGQVPTTNPTPDAERAAQQQELMVAVVERTRHFLGDPDAPVTIIEFSDFQ